MVKVDQRYETTRSRTSFTIGFSPVLISKLQEKEIKSRADENAQDFWLFSYCFKYNVKEVERENFRVGVLPRE